MYSCWFISGMDYIMKLAWYQESNQTFWKYNEQRSYKADHLKLHNPLIWKWNEWTSKILGNYVNFQKAFTCHIRFLNSSLCRPVIWFYLLPFFDIELLSLGHSGALCWVFLWSCFLVPCKWLNIKVTLWESSIVELDV